MEHAIHITRHASRQLMKLEPGDLERVQVVLERLASGDHRNSRHLAGWPGVCRTRVGRLRVVWRQEAQIVRVGAAWYRDEVYRRLPLALADAPEHEPAEPEDEAQVQDSPSYQWTGQSDADFARFVYGAYRFSPVLTPEQEEVYSALEAAVFGGSAHQTCVYRIQSAPGTGKSVCAALFAARMRREWGFYTALLVPRGLAQDLAGYPDVRRELALPHSWERFCLCTFHEWLQILVPVLADQTASADEELAALKQAARQIHMREPEVEGFTNRDAVLYQAFVLESGHKKDAALWQEAERVDRLRRIRQSAWEQALRGKHSRHASAMLLSAHPPPPPVGFEGAVLVVDEAQDYLLAEIQALLALRAAWERDGVPTVLVLLGDLNQRVQPTGFYWDQIRSDGGAALPAALVLRRNYRNSRFILEFANRFLEFGRRHASAVRARSLPAVPDPNDAFEKGEAVRLLEVESATDALAFLEHLSRPDDVSGGERYLVRRMAQQAKVLWPGASVSRSDMVILDASSAKGREFDGCVAFRLFDRDGTPSLEESFVWYTVLTRARLRLLVVATTDELSGVGRHLFDRCERFNRPEDAALWVMDTPSEVDLWEVPSDVEARLLRACELGCPYWDTYPALREARLDANAWEQTALLALSRRSDRELREELEQVPPGMVSLRCLLLRALNRSWEAVACAASLEGSDPGEFRRLLLAIANGLESGRATEALAAHAWTKYHGGLSPAVEHAVATSGTAIRMLYEGARVRLRCGEPWPDGYAFAKAAAEPGTLVSTAAKAVADNLRELLERSP
jgi:hypothetical protein